MSKILRTLVVLLIAFTFSNRGISQDKILTMSGKVINCQIIDGTQIVIKYNFTTKRNKVKERMIHRSEVFSIIIEGEETVLFVSDESSETFDVAETRVFITGEGDGDKFDTKRLEVLGYVLGSASGYVSKANIIVLLTTPTLYTIYQYIPNIKVKEETMSDLKFKNNEIYLQGYDVNARNKRVRKALQSSVLGSILGSIIFKLAPYS